MSYEQLKRKLEDDLNALKIEYSKLEKSKQHGIQSGQQSMYDFMRSRRHVAQFYKNGEIVLLNRGDLSRGFEHILDRHYCGACSGIVTARELLNIDRVLQKGRRMTTFEMNERDHSAEGFEDVTVNNIRLRLIIAPDKNGVKRIVTFYSDRP